jgi:peptide/nickel transport system permease protein
MRSLRGVTACAAVALFLAVALPPWQEWLGGRVDLAHALAGPSLAHPFGADALGRDLLGRLAGALRGAVLPLWGVVIAGTLCGCAA